MKKVKVTTQLTLRNVGAFFALSVMPVMAQSGRPINSVETRPGTSAPSYPNETLDSTRSRSADQTLGAGQIQLGTGESSATADLPRDAGSATADRKASRSRDQKYKRDRKLNKINRGEELPYSNEREPRLPTTPPINR